MQSPVLNAGTLEATRTLTIKPKLYVNPVADIVIDITRPIFVEIVSEKSIIRAYQSVSNAETICQDTMH